MGAGRDAGDGGHHIASRECGEINGSDKGLGPGCRGEGGKGVGPWHVFLGYQDAVEVDEDPVVAEQIELYIIDRLSGGEGRAVIAGEAAGGGWQSDGRPHWADGGACGQTINAADRKRTGAFEGLVASGYSAGAESGAVVLNGEGGFREEPSGVEIVIKTPRAVRQHPAERVHHFPGLGIGNHFDRRNITRGLHRETYGPDNINRIRQDYRQRCGGWEGAKRGGRIVVSGIRRCDIAGPLGAQESASDGHVEGHGVVTGINRRAIVIPDDITENGGDGTGWRGDGDAGGNARVD